MALALPFMYQNLGCAPNNWRSKHVLAIKATPEDLSMVRKESIKLKSDIFIIKEYLFRTA